jgi:uncharacterized protein involved in exopolysaccharide biosynthesis
MMALETISRLEPGSQPREDLKRWVLLLIRWRWLVISITFSSIVAATVIAFVVTPIYEAKTTLMPVENEENGGLMGGLGQLGGLAALAGLQGTRNRTETEAIALLKSRQFTEAFIAQDHLLPDLFPERWDNRLNAWKAGVRPPTLWDGYRRFNRNVRFVDEDQKTEIVTLRIDLPDPQEAANWANELVKRVNAEMQKRALTEASTTLEYLKQQLKTTQVASIQNALQSLIEANLKQEAFAHVRSDYAFRVIDPAAPPDWKGRVSPHRSIYLIVGAFAGVLLSVLVIMGIVSVQNVRRWVKSDPAAG